MKEKEIIKVKKFPVFIILSLFAIILLMSIVSSVQSSGFSSGSKSTSYSSTQWSQPGFKTYYSGQQIKDYWPVLENSETCKGRQDFMIQVAPAGCQPAVVRSDLLEEQNVPVFCQLDAIKLNPLIEVDSIESISFSGEYPDGVAGVGYHPARAALRTQDTLLGSPIINNVGYVVVLLKRNEIESEIPEWIEGELNARIKYDVQGSMGVGRAEYFLPVLTDEDWELYYKQYGFWEGKGYVRLNSVDENTASVSIYRDADTRIGTVNVNRGSESHEIYIPGYYCLASLSVRFDGLELPEKKAVLQVDDNLMEVYEGSRIFDSCTVRAIESYGFGSGSVEISCPRERFYLNLNLKEVKLNIGGQPLNYTIGEKISEVGADADVYLVYSGTLYNSNKYSILISSAKGKSVDLDKIKKNIARYLSRRTFSDAGEIKKNIDNLLKTDKVVSYIVTASDSADIGDKKIYLDGIELGDTEISRDFNLYFDNAIQSYESVSANYPAEKIKAGNEEILAGKIALRGAIKLAEETGQFNKQAELIKKYMEKFPDEADEMKSKLDPLLSYDEEDASYVFELGGETIYVSLKEIDVPGFEEAGVKVMIDNNAHELIKGEAVSDGSFIQGDAGAYLKLVDFNRDEARFEYYCKEDGEGYSRDQITLDRRRQELICGRTVFVDEINFDEVASVKIIPNIENTETLANFSFKIGIEKRGIQLSPSKTQELIDNLDESIAKWEGINEKLGKLVKALKGGCLAASAIAIAGTFLDSISGKATVRKTLMNMDGGWKDKCAELVDDTGNNIDTLDDCFRMKADEIRNDVNKVTALKNQQNQILEGLDKKYPVEGSGFLGTGIGKAVDTDALGKDYVGKVSQLNIDKNLKVGPEGKEIEVQSIVSGLKEDDWTESRVTLDELRRIHLANLALQDSSLSEAGRKAFESELYSVLSPIDGRKKAEQNLIDANNLIQDKLGRTLHTDSYGDKNTINAFYRGDVLTPQESQDLGLPYATKTNAQQIIWKGEVYLLNLEKQPNGQYTIVEVNKKVENQYIRVDPSEDEIAEEIKSRFKFTELDASTYKNPYKNYKVKYFATEPYKGMPSVVPFDIKNGWYAATRQTLPAFSNIKSYQSSGRVASFWVCNVGENGKEEYIGGDDICTQFNPDTGQPLDVFPGLQDYEAKQIVTRAKRALEQAATQSGKSKISIDGVNVLMNKEAMTDTSEARCADYMDPTLCYYIFNLCDPVICPTSRCNLGGTYQVSNVIQSGIIGSIFLCLPNAKEGIVVPVCLTGINAGLDSYISILKSSRDCLQESLDTGKNVGICDEIKSIYMCEFFWRQIAPMANIIIPSLIDLALGKGDRGGGEYSNVMAAWETTQESISYFKDSYAVDAMKSFQVRSTEEAGTEVCKAFISTRYPTDIKTFVEPDSPPQFSAWFSEIPYSDATVPATSQYKVYYHIYAGKDSGVYYTIYLRNPPGDELYQTAEQVVVSQGYITVGDYADETRDFTSPAGYKELCVRINDQDECGFGKVSSSFAVNYIQDVYINQQATEQITGEKDCIQGTANILGGLQPNIQEGVQDAVFPSIYEKGIIRVCSTENPGKGVDESRWKDMGYCDDTRIRCWLDQDSIKNTITNENVGLLNKTMKDVEAAAVDVALEKRRITEGEAQQEGTDRIEEIQEEINYVKASLEILKTAESLENQGIVESIKTKASSVILDIENAEEELIFNHHKAVLMLKKAEVYGYVAEANYLLIQEKTQAERKSAPAQTPQKETEEEETKRGFTLDNDRIYLDGGDTGLSLVKNNGLYLVKYKGESIGTIRENGAIIINKRNGLSLEILNIELYRFDSNLNEFVPLNIV